MDYEKHKKFYDITDRAGRILSKFNQFSHHIDPDHNMPNSLQSTLGKIYRYEGSTQREIASIYQKDYQNTIRYITDLEKRGLVMKKSIDARRKGIWLTEKGAEINNRLMEARGKVVEAAMAEISDEEFAIAKSTLERMIEAVSREIEWYESGEEE